MRVSATRADVCFFLGEHICQQICDSCSDSLLLTQMEKTVNRYTGAETDLTDKVRWYGESSLSYSHPKSYSEPYPADLLPTLKTALCGPHH